MAQAVWVWDPSEYKTKEAILIIGDMDLCFARFLMNVVSTSTFVVNTSYLPECALLNSNCGDVFHQNKQFLLENYNNISIKHNIDVRVIEKCFPLLKFDCVLFLYPQCEGAVKLLAKQLFTLYHQKNAALLQDYILNVSNVISWNGNKSQIDFVIKKNQIRNWIEKSMSDQFRTEWESRFNITKSIFLPLNCNGYTPRNEKGRRFNPGLSFMISSKVKVDVLPKSVLYCDGLNIEFEEASIKHIGQIGHGTYDIARDYKKAFSVATNTRCKSLKSVNGIYFVNCIAEITGELYDTGESISVCTTFKEPKQCYAIMTKQFAWIVKYRKRISCKNSVS